MRRLEARVLILPRDKPLLVIHHHVGSENIPEGGLAFKQRTRFAQLGLWVQGCYFNAELLDFAYR